MAFDFSGVVVTGTNVRAINVQGIPAAALGTLVLEALAARGVSGIPAAPDFEEEGDALAVGVQGFGVVADSSSTGVASVVGEDHE